MTQNYATNRVVNELLMPLKKRSGAMIGWGIFCIVLGTIGLFAPIAFSVGVTIFIGAMLLVSGATGLALFWKAEGWGARTAAIVLALLTALTGLLLMFYPIAGTETLTLFLASYFIAIGLVKGWPLCQYGCKRLGTDALLRHRFFTVGRLPLVGLASERYMDFRHLRCNRTDLRRMDRPYVRS